MSHPGRLFASVAFATCLCALPAKADGPASLLAPPGDAPVERPTPDADEPDLVPEPPGAEVPDVRYPLPGEDEDEGAEATTVRIPSRITTRLRSLDASLRTLAQGGGGNIVNAVLSMLTGGLAITLGALKDNPTDFMSVYLYVYGGASATRGVLDLVLTPDASGPAITYQHMPMGSRDEVRERLRFGENALQNLAEQALIARVLDASINLAAGVAVVPIYLAPNDFEIVNPLDYFILIGAGVSLVSGIISLLGSSGAEQRWSAYQELRQRLEREREDELEHRTARASEGGAEEAEEESLPTALAPPRPSFQLSVAPTPNGAFGGFSLTF